MKRTSVLFLLLVLFCSVDSQAQYDDFHSDYCNPAIPGVICNSIIQTHEGFCDNVSDTDGSTWDVDCRDFSTRSPRDYEIECGPSVAEWSTASNPACWARATVLCPTPQATGNYETFECFGSSTRSGFLGYDPQGRPMRGVYCEDNRVGGTVKTCGCIVTGVGNHAKFGNPTQQHAHYWHCN